MHKCSSSFLYIQANTYYFFFLTGSHSYGCQVVSHCSFDLHFFNDEWYWTSFHMLAGHSYVFFRKKCLKSSAHFKFSYFCCCCCWVMWVLNIWPYMRGFIFGLFILFFQPIVLSLCYYHPFFDYTYWSLFSK